MSNQQSGATERPEQQGATSGERPSQMQASGTRPPRIQAAFGSGGGAAIVFRDYASI
jgi:hypothetical protein